MTWAGIKSRTLTDSWSSHPGAPQLFLTEMASFDS